MTRLVKPRSRSPWRRRVRRVLLIFGLVLVVALGVTYHYVTQPERLRRYTQAYLQTLFVTPVTVEGADFTLRDGLRVHGVAVADVGSGASSPPLLRFAHLRIRHHWWALLLGQYRVERIFASRATCRAVYDTALGKFNWQRVWRAEAASRDEASSALPAIQLRNVRVVVEKANGPDRSKVEELHLDLVGTPVAGAGRVYDLRWRALGGGEESGALRVNLVRGVLRDLEAGTPWLSLEAASLVALAADSTASAWVRALGLRGRFRLKDFAIPLRAGVQGASGVTVEFADARVSVPLDAAEEKLAPARRYVRLEDTTGSVTIQPSGAEATFAGFFHGSSCRGRIRLDGPVAPGMRLDALGFALEVELADWLMPRCGEDASPAETRFVDRWPRLRRFYRDYDPHGRVTVRVALGKAYGPDAPIEIRRATIDALDADASHRAFPYRVSNLTGRIEINADGVHLLGLTGEHDGATIVTQGWLRRMRRTTEAELYFSGDGVLLDDDLCEAISGPYRKAWESFDPRGVADITVRMTRPEAEGVDPVPWSIAVDAKLRDADAAFAGFPYRVHHLAGELAISRDAIVVEHLDGRAGGGSVHVEGVAALASAEMENLDLTVDARAVAVNDTLLRALAPEPRRIVQALSPTGRVDILARLGWREDRREVDYDVVLFLDHNAIEPALWPVPVDSISGLIHLRPEGVELAGLRGRVGKGVVEVEGRLGSTEGGSPSEVNLRGLGLVLNETLRRALPEKARQVLADWMIAGPFDFDARVTTPLDYANSTIPYRITFSPAGTVITYAACPMPLRITAGAIQLDNEGIHFRDLRVRVENARLEVEGAITTHPAATVADLRFDATDVALTEAWRTAIPWRWRRAWNEHQPVGTFDVRAGRIRFSRSGADAPPEWDLSGRLLIHDGGLDLGARLREITGVIEAEGRARGDLGSLALTGRLDLEHAVLNHWRIENLRGRFSRGGGGHWSFPDLVGSLYGGSLAGRVELASPAGGSRYDVSATAQGVRLNDFLRATRKAANKTREEPLQGTISGRLFLSGIPGDPASRKGGGRFAIADAELYRLPLILAVLQVLDLSPPQRAAFNEAQAEYYLVGDTLRLKKVLLRGGVAAMIGEGKMALSGAGLDLKLVTVSPHRWAETPVLSELLEGVARELIEVVVTGTLGNPQVVAKPLRSIDEAFKRWVVPKQGRGGASPKAERPPGTP